LSNEVSWQDMFEVFHPHNDPKNTLHSSISHWRYDCLSLQPRFHSH